MYTIILLQSVFCVMYMDVVPCDITYKTSVLLDIDDSNQD